MTTLNDEQRRQLLIEKEKLRAQYKRAVETGQVKRAAPPPAAAPVTQVIVNTQRESDWFPSWARLTVAAISGGTVLLVIGAIFRGAYIGNALLTGLSVWASLVILLFVNLIGYRLYWLMSGCFWVLMIVGLFATGIGLLFGVNMGNQSLGWLGVR